jgi:hypothetical protein
MRRAFLTALLLTLSLFAPLGTVNAADVRSSWDYNKLSDVTDPNKMRAIFGFFPNRSVNDDYSFTVTLQDAKPYQYFSVLLSPCTSFKKVDMNFDACIENVAYRKKGDANWNDSALSKISLGEPTTTLKKGGDLVVGKPVTNDPNTLRPPGDRATIWEMPGAKHSKGSSYLVRATIRHPGADNISSIDGGLQRLFTMEILPISFTASGATITQDKFKVEEFPEGYEYKLKLRMGVFIKSLSGWFLGRIQDPSIDRNGPAGYLEVSGTPAKVPVGITNVINKSEIPQKYLGKCPEVGGCYWTANTFGKAAFFPAIDRPDPQLLADFEEVPGGVKTAATLTHWELDSSRLSDVTTLNSSAKQCTDKLYGPSARVFMGAVSSNATLYQGTPPEWDELSKSFSFKVASPHLDEKGLPNKGFYTLYIPVDQANCRWGQDASLPQAQVQIVNKDGTSSITTAVATQENGLLRFNIAGFGYSSPTIRLKMGEQSFAPTQAVEKATAGPAKKVINCIKGKSVKQVVSLKPKCPTGYKKR